MTRLFLAAGMMAVTFSTGLMAQDCGPSGATEIGVIEIVQFRLAEGVKRDDFISAAAGTMPALCELEGFIGRALSEGDDGAWTDYVKWVGPDAAEAAIVGAKENEALLPFVTSIDPDSMILTYQTPVVLD